MKASHNGNYRITGVSSANVVESSPKINENKEQGSVRIETPPSEPARRGRPRRNT
jgi:hypothetical protein